MPAEVSSSEFEPLDHGKSSSGIGGITNRIALSALGWRLYGSRKDRSEGKPTTADAAYFENLAELDRHRSQLRMTEAANAANIRDMELSRSAEHLRNRITAAREASVIVDQGRRVGEILVDDKALGIKTGGYRLTDRRPDPLETMQSPAEDIADGPKVHSEGSPGRVASFSEGTRTVIPALFDMRGSSVQVNPDTGKNEAIPGRKEMAEHNKALTESREDLGGMSTKESTDAKNAEAAQRLHKQRTGKDIPEGQIQPQKPLMIPTAQSAEYDKKREAGEPGFDRTAEDEASKY